MILGIEPGATFCRAGTVRWADRRRDAGCGVVCGEGAVDEEGDEEGEEVGSKRHHLLSTQRLANTHLFNRGGERWWEGVGWDEGWRGCRWGGLELR